MILAGDVGGTKTLLGLFEAGERRPRRIAVRELATLAYPDLAAMLADFLADPPVPGARIRVASFGVAGPVLGTSAELTNAPFVIDAHAVARAFDIARVVLLNDLEAMAHAVPFLEESELYTLQAGDRAVGGNLGLIAAGTGLGQALLHHVDGGFIPSPSEAGHADWAARNEREIVVLRALIKWFGRAEVEQVISGPGLLNICRVTHEGACSAVDGSREPDAAAISSAALEGRCPGCAEALSIFVEAYGAEAGNLALRAVATGGVFVGGGIAPKILPALTDGRFMRAFLAKEPFRQMLEHVPVKIVLNAESGLLGAAVGAVEAMKTRN